MQRLATFWLAVFAIALGARTATIQRAEVRVDEGESQPMVLGTNILTTNYWEGDFALSFSTTNLSVGPHHFEVRMQADNGVWGAWQGRWFRVTGIPVLVGAEWFVDSDPGTGKGQRIAAPEDGAWDEADEDISVPTLAGDAFTVGPHTVFVRCLDSDGNWGTPNQTGFYVADRIHLTAAEWTTNALATPGTGFPMKAKDGAFDEAEEELEATVSADLLGPVGSSQTIYVRVRDNLGRWSTRDGIVWDDANATWAFDPIPGWANASVAGVTVTDMPEVPQAPAISQQPASVRVALGMSSSLEVQAGGWPPFTYQWRLNGQDIAEATNAVYAIPAVELAHGGSYTVVVANALGSAESNPALLEIDVPALALTDVFTQRQVFTAADFTGATNNAQATFEPPGEPRHAGKVGGKSLWMTWKPQISGVATFSTAGSSFDTLLAVYTGSALGSLVEVASDEDRGGFLTSEVSFNAVAGTEYQIAVDGFAGASGNVLLHWALVANAPPLPQITKSPANRVAREDEQVSLGVVSPTPGVSYQWYRSGQVLVGETQATLTFTAAAARAGTYRARVTSADGLAVVESEDALVEVTPKELPLPTADQLSADKWEDLYLEDPVGAQLHGRARAMGFTSVTVGVGGRYTDLQGSTRSPDDPMTCGMQGGVSRWFRFRVEPKQVVTFDTLGSQVDVVVGVYTRGEVEANRWQLRSQGCAMGRAGGEPAQVAIWAQQATDYLVMVAVAGESAGRVRLNWQGQTPTQDPPGGRAGIVDGHVVAEWVVQPGRYAFGTTGDLLQWQGLFQTNITGGLFQYRDPEPTVKAKFYRLVPAQ